MGSRFHGVACLGQEAGFLNRAHAKYAGKKLILREKVLDPIQFQPIFQYAS